MSDSVSADSSVRRLGPEQVPAGADGIAFSEWPIAGFDLSCREDNLVWPASIVTMCQHLAVKARRIFVSALVASGALLSAPGPSAPADACPDAEVVFARGTTEPPGVGPTGEAFVTSLRSHAGTKSVGVYPVDYPATTEFPTALDGIRDASTHVEVMAAKCPKTQMVLGGYSQGAAVVGFVTANVIPDGAPASGVPNPMPPDVADHIAAVTLFGKPSDRFMHLIAQPPVTVGPLYAPKTLDLCIPDDLICADHGDFDQHTQYADDGLVDQAAVFAASHLSASPAGNAPSPPAVLAASPAPAATPQSPPAPAAAPSSPPAPAAAPSSPPAPAATPSSPPAPAGTPPSPRPTSPPSSWFTMVTCGYSC
jgi:cutinase